MEVTNAATDERKTWVSTTLTVFGDVQTITLGCDKTLGSSDGFTFQGQGIVCSS